MLTESYRTSAEKNTENIFLYVVRNSKAGLNLIR